MAKLYNLARMFTSTTGGGTLLLTTAVNSFVSFAQAGAQDGDEVHYAINEAGNREVGRGIYNSAGPTLTRNVLRSTNNNNPINLNGNAQVVITALAEDFIGDAPVDGEIYARQDGEWIPITVSWDGGTY